MDGTSNGVEEQRYAGFRNLVRGFLCIEYRAPYDLFFLFFGDAAEEHWMICCRHPAPPKNKNGGVVGAFLYTESP
jgi:hypothetical protein